MIKSFSDLIVYRNSKKLYPIVMRLTKIYPREGKSLADQTCRSANAIHSDIAEGYGRSVAEFKMYLTRALGSCNETISHLDDARNVEFVKSATAQMIIAKYNIVGKQIYQLRQNWK